MSASDDIDKEIELGRQMMEQEDPEIVDMMREADDEFRDIQTEAKRVFDDLVENHSKEVLLYLCSYLRMWDFGMWHDAPEPRIDEDAQLEH
jgi:hypothetical protein